MNVCLLVLNGEEIKINLDILPYDAIFPSKGKFIRYPCKLSTTYNLNLMMHDFFIIFASILVLLIGKSVAYAPPRFDTFLSTVTGSWWIPSPLQPQQQQQQTINSSDQILLYEVEEVMRSCGGAVQGIKDNGNYLNRADDGFLYYDCGSYSYGAVDILGGEDTNYFNTSFTLGSKNERILINSSLVNKAIDQSLESRINYSLHLINNNKVCGNAEPDLFDDKEDYVKNSSSSINWDTSVRCLMPSKTQRWMLQRVRWEKSLYEQSAASDDEETVVSSNFAAKSHLVFNFDASDRIICWTATSPGVLCVEEDIDDQSLSFQVGVMSLETKKVKAVIRHYDKHTNGLCQVTLQEGTLN